MGAQSEPAGKEDTFPQALLLIPCLHGVFRVFSVAGTTIKRGENELLAKNRNNLCCGRCFIRDGNVVSFLRKSFFSHPERRSDRPDVAVKLSGGFIIFTVLKPYPAWRLSPR